MWTCQCPKTKRGRNKSTKQWKVIILLLVTLPLSRIVGVMVMEMAMVITDAMVTEKEWLLRVSVLLPDSEAVLSSGFSPLPMDSTTHRRLDKRRQRMLVREIPRQ